jgi:hypothetical protein
MNCSRSSAVCEPQLRRRLETRSLSGLSKWETAADTTAVTPGLDSEPEMVSTLLAHGNSLGTSGRQTLSAIAGDGAIDNGAAIDAFPGIEHKKEIREPL